MRSAASTVDACVPDTLVIDGYRQASELRELIRQQIEDLRHLNGLIPGLAVVLVGENAASEIYIRNKSRALKQAGMRSFVHRLPAGCDLARLKELIDQLNGDPQVHGILIQLPLPGHIDALAAMAWLDPAKDVDGLHVLNSGKLALGAVGMIPCTPLGCLMLLCQSVGSLGGRRALVLGRSAIVGRPMGQLLLRANCTVTLGHSHTHDLPNECQRADILVVAVGQARMVRGSWIKPGAVVIDVGINRQYNPQHEREELVGDVSFDEALGIAGAITPVPGGVGPMTVACLLVNTLAAACRQSGAEPPAQASPDYLLARSDGVRR